MTCENGKYFIQGDPLRFIHFSGFGASAEKCMRDWLPEDEVPFHTLYREYAQQHEKNNADDVSHTAWTYGVCKNNEKIDDSLRLRYRSNYDVMFSIDNPFAMSNSEMRRRLIGIAKPHTFGAKVNKAVSLLVHGQWQEFAERFKKQF